MERLPVAPRLVGNYARTNGRQDLRAEQEAGTQRLHDQVLTPGVEIPKHLDLDHIQAKLELGVLHVALDLVENARHFWLGWPRQRSPVRTKNHLADQTLERELALQIRGPCGHISPRRPQTPQREDLKVGPSGALSTILDQALHLLSKQVVGDHHRSRDFLQVRAGPLASLVHLWLDLAEFDSHP